MSGKTLHLQKNRLNQDINIIWLLIPSIIFALTLLIFLYFFKAKPQNNSLSTVKGETTDSQYELDNTVP